MSKKRMGRPPAGPGGTKVEDLPRVTIRLEPELRRRALAHAKETGRPLWRLLQDLLRAHLDAAPSGDPPASDVEELGLSRLDPRVRAALHQVAAEERRPAWELAQEAIAAYLDVFADPDESPAAEEPANEPGELAAAPATLPPVGSQSPFRRRFELTYSDARALFAALYWRQDLAPEPQDTPDEQHHRRALADLAALFAERKPPRGGSVEDTWRAEISLDQCRRLRKVVREYLAAAEARVELAMRDTRAEWRPDGGRRMGPADEEKQRKRIRREIRTVNGKARRALKRIPWR